MLIFRRKPLGHVAHRSTTLRRHLTVASLLGCAACGGADTPTGPRIAARLRITGRPPQSDSISALPSQPIAIEITDRVGAPVEGEEVVFEALPRSASSRAPAAALCEHVLPRCLSVSDPDDFTLAGFGRVTLRTDAAGRARVRIQNGVVLASSVVRITAANGALRDSLVLTVTPGAVAGVRFQSADTTMMLGDSLALAATAVDRMGHPVPGAVSYRVDATSPAITFDTLTRRARGAAFGSAALIATGTAGADSLTVRVVPRGRLLAWMPFPETRIRLLNTDGTAAANVLDSIDSNDGVAPRFTPSRTQFSATVGSSVTVADTTGSNRRNATGTAFLRIAASRLLDDGTLLVAGVQNTVSNDPFRPPAFVQGLFRVDSSRNLTLLRTMASVGSEISADGSRVLFVHAERITSPEQLMVLDVATGVERPVVTASARFMRFSPDGTQIAFLAGSSTNLNQFTLHVVNVDGTNFRQLSPLLYQPGLTWSPDGAYLLAAYDANDPIGYRLRMVRVSDGAVVPLSFRGANGVGLHYRYPDWR